MLENIVYRDNRGGSSSIHVYLHRIEDRPLVIESLKAFVHELPSTKPEQKKAALDALHEFESKWIMYNLVHHHTLRALQEFEASLAVFPSDEKRLLVREFIEAMKRHLANKFQQLSRRVS